MQQFIFQDKTQEERIDLLGQYKKAEVVTYKRHLTDAEIDNESKNLANKVKELAFIEDEKKEVNRQYKEQIDGIRGKMDVISKTLLDGQKEVTEKCFKVLNIEGREVGYYNVSGELVKVRPLIDDDLQMDMFEGSTEASAVALPETSNAALPVHDDIEDAEVVNE